jgi:cell division protein FtsZ
MTHEPSLSELKPRIVVFGVGGAGGNAVNNMIDACLQGVEFVCANTDAQALSRSKAQTLLQLGGAITEGLGAGARPEVGQAAAQESQAEIVQTLEGAHMVFVAAGMGGGTGTGAAPVIARIARERGILTVAVVTKPFHFEGQRRMQLAEAGVQELRKHVDTLIVIPNQNLFRIANDRTTFAEAFQMADQVLYSGVRGVTDLMVMPGLINLDFADVRTVMAEMGTAMMGTGEADGPNRALDAAHVAITNPLLDIMSMKGARGVLINITGGFDMTLYEVDAAANEIRAEVDSNANIILGSTFEEHMEGRMRVAIVATGIDDEEVVQTNTIVPPARKAAPVPAPLRRAEPPLQPIPEEPRPVFEAEPVAERKGFNLFGWMRGEDPPPRRPEDTPEPPVSEAYDPPNDEDLEIPAFLRRQMGPR